MSKDTKNTKLWKLFQERDNKERLSVEDRWLYQEKTKRNDSIDSEINKPLRD